MAEKAGKFKAKHLALYAVKMTLETGQLERMMRLHKLKLSEQETAMLKMRGSPGFFKISELSEAFRLPCSRVENIVEGAARKLALQMVRTNAVEAIAKESSIMMQAPISVLQLSQNMENALALNSIFRVKDLAQMTVNELMRIKCFGKKSIADLQERLSIFGISIKNNETHSEGCVDSLGLSPRAANIIKMKGIKRLDDLVRISELDLLSIRGCSQNVIKEINEKLSALGLALGK